ncbi:C1 family peptidase [Exilibacterium tricleocarpae]|uniref:C1 family peptidase n=1 Tax=Exilibacterium tricleocarpae TaxID=2591008 RepID=A0A545TUX2_9GAMM|nr:C1 family peptidase [Exilibacterium tricleocarpae]TQV81020.1 C1 family peptidase [Exilibacterium tricleocarpae]
MKNTTCDQKPPTPSQRRRRHSNPYGRRTGGGTFRLGCLKDLPDRRDISVARVNKDNNLTHTIQALSEKITSAKESFLLSPEEASLPASCELAHVLFTEIEDQRTLGSCTANAVISLIEYLIKSASSRNTDLSRIFLYKVTRNLMGERGLGDSGAFIRDTIKAMKIFGAPPERWWPYDTENFDDEPDAFIYTMAQNFQSIDYLRLDAPGVNGGEETLKNVKCCIADGFPAAFGFWVTEAVFEAGVGTGVIHLPDDSTAISGGHAVLAVGYDDAKKAIKIRNSWGTSWGDNGYGWLSYDYVLEGMAFDFWTIFSQEWVDTQTFA